MTLAERASGPADRGSSEQAQALVEFALILPVLLMLILGLFDVARAVEEENTLAFAAREGTPYAIVHGQWSARATQIGPCSACSDPTITRVVAAKAIGVPNITAVLDYPDGTNEPGYRVSVDATAPFVPLPSQWLLNGALSITLRGGSELVIQY